MDLAVIKKKIADKLKSAASLKGGGENETINILEDVPIKNTSCWSVWSR